MKKILYSLILSASLLTACGSETDVPYENVVESTVDDTFPISTIETELADHINSVSPYSDDLVKRVYVTQEDDNIFISVHLNCHGFDSIGQELILVRDSVVEYTNENDYPVSTLDICSIPSDSNGILWMSSDLKEGSYVDKVNNRSISLISLEDLSKSDTVKLSTANISTYDPTSYNAVIIEDNYEKEGYFDGDIVNGYASGEGIFYSTNSSGYDYELHSSFIDGYTDGYYELIINTGDKICGNYTMGARNGTFTYYINQIGEFSEEYKDGERISDEKYIKVNDSYIYYLVDEMLKSDKNPSNWSDDEIGISGISDINSQEYKDAVSNWQNAIDEYEDLIFESYAQYFGMSKDDVETAYTRAAIGEPSFTYIE